MNPIVSFGLMALQHFCVNVINGTGLGKIFVCNNYDGFNSMQKPEIFDPRRYMKIYWMIPAVLVFS